MEKEFISYEEALALKELGFNEPCLFAYNQDDENKLMTAPQLSSYQINTGKNSDIGKINKVTAPLYQQAFRWLMIKCEQICEKEISLKFWLDGSGSCKLMNLDDELFDYDSEIECLKKLIEIVKKK